MKYLVTVTLHKTFSQEIDLTVHADTAKEAREIAKNRVDDGDYWNTSDSMLVKAQVEKCLAKEYKADHSIRRTGDQNE